MSSFDRKVILIACHVSLTGLLYGLDTGSIGPITEMSQFRDSIGLLSSAQQGIYVACFLLSASISSLASGHVSDWISRKYGILTGALLTLVGTVLSASSPSFALLITARLITGVGAGQAIAVTTVYLVEIAPLETRAVSACLLQSYIVLGITTGYFVTFGSRTLYGSIAWRVPFVIQAGVSLLLCIGLVFIPFSPRWLVQVGRSDDARSILHKLRSEQRAETELHEIEVSLASALRQTSPVFKEMFTRRYLPRTMLGVFLMAFQQLTGIDAVLYYAPILFQQAGFASSRASFLASGVTGIVMIICTIPAQIWVERWGRRKPLIIGGFLMAISFIIIGGLYAEYGTVAEGGVLLSSRSAQWTIIVLIYIFIANFSWSWAIIGKIFACEIIPTRLRAKVCALEQLANWMVNFAVALTAPLFLRHSPSGPYFLYGFATLLAVGVVYAFMPETKNRSLEEIEQLFEKTESRPRPTGAEEFRPNSTGILS